MAEKQQPQDTRDPNEVADTQHTGLSNMGQMSMGELLGHPELVAEGIEMPPQLTIGGVIEDHEEPPGHPTQPPMPTPSVSVIADDPRWREGMWRGRHWITGSRLAFEHIRPRMGEGSVITREGSEAPAPRKVGITRPVPLRAHLRRADTAIDGTQSGAARAAGQIHSGASAAAGSWGMGSLSQFLTDAARRRQEEREAAQKEEDEKAAKRRKKGE